MWDDVEIITLDQAKKHARITHTSEDEDLEFKLRNAHGIVLDYIYLSRPDDAERLADMQAWGNDDTAPHGVKAAIVRMFVNLAEFRGDDRDRKVTDDPNDLPPDVKQLLKMHKDPVVA